MKLGEQMTNQLRIQGLNKPLKIPVVTLSKWRDKVAQLEALVDEQTKLLDMLRYKLDKLEQEIIYQLEAENEALKDAANSLLGLIDCLGGGFSLDDAGPDRQTLAELVDYPNHMNKKIALLAREESE